MARTVAFPQPEEESEPDAGGAGTPAEEGGRNFESRSTDEWVHEVHSYIDLRLYVICDAGGAQPCRTVTLQDHWDTDRIRERLYCPVCRARYRTKFGHLAELRMKEKRFYVAVAWYPGTGVQHRLSAEDLLEDRGLFLRPLQAHPNSFVMEEALVNELSEVSWDQIKYLRVERWFCPL